MIAVVEVKVIEVVEVAVVVVVVVEVVVSKVVVVEVEVVLGTCVCLEMINISILFCPLSGKKIGKISKRVSYVI